MMPQILFVCINFKLLFNILFPSFAMFLGAFMAVDVVHRWRSIATSSFLGVSAALLCNALPSRFVIAITVKLFLFSPKPFLHVTSPADFSLLNISGLVTLNYVECLAGFWAVYAT